MTKIASIILAVSAPLVVVAFWPLYFSRPFAAIDPYTHFHALTGSLWFVLLIAQPLSIHYRRLALHRALGRCSYVIAPLFVLAGVLLSHHRLVSMSDETFAAEGYSHYLPFYASVVFSAAYALGLHYRRVPKAHGRFMLLTAMPLVDPVIGRVLFFYFPRLPSPGLYHALTFALATAAAALLVFSYRAQPAARRALVRYFSLLVALELGWFTLALTTPWLYVVAWFRSLPLT
ncbi:MAG TPA: hypothetical protein VIQ24_00455 [Pyrinomonadaceae bacterium]